MNDHQVDGRELAALRDLRAAVSSLALWVELDAGKQLTSEELAKFLSNQVAKLEELATKSRELQRRPATFGRML